MVWVLAMGLRAGRGWGGEETDLVGSGDAGSKEDISPTSKSKCGGGSSEGDKLPSLRGDSGEQVSEWEQGSARARRQERCSQRGRKRGSWNLRHKTL